MVGTLVSDAPVATTPQYCQIADVALVLQTAEPSAANDEGEPTRTQWETLIKRLEDHIDHTCGTSWRARRVLLEIHDWTTWLNEEGFYMVQLRHAPVLTLATASGDSLEVYNGSAYEEWVGVKTVGRNGDYYLEEPAGVLRLKRNTIPLNDDARVRISYRYGESAVPPEIAHATALLTAAQLATRDRRSSPDGTDAMTVRETVEDWRREAYTILAKFQRPGRGY